MSLSVLVVEDSSTDAKLVVQALRALEPALTHDVVEDEDAMRAALANGRYDVVLSDWSMPRFSALAALRVLRDLDADIPFIIVSGTVGEELAVEAMRAGARDYVLKDRLGRLVPAVERELRERERRATGRRTASALAESERRFSRLGESGILGIAIADVDGAVLEANAEYLRTIGFDRDDVAAGRIRWADLTPADQRPLVERAVVELQQTGSALPWEVETFRRDGTRVPILIGISMLDYPRCIAFTIDLTERKRIEATLRETEHQLRQAQKMEAVGRLAGGIAHDFNNLLSVILSYCELLLDDLNPADPLREDIGEMHKAGQRAANLTRQLLLFSRQQVQQPRSLALDELLGSMENMLARLVGEDVDLVLLLSPCGTVRADPGSIEQIVMNLVVNARDAMPRGGKLTLETRPVVLDEEHARGHVGVVPGSYVLLAVTDDGIGMDRATQARIFEPFFTTKGVGQGTGLGLSTVFGLVQQSGGTIWVYSEPGSGTTFKIYLPRLESAVEETAPIAAPITLSGDETILLVEDEDQVRVVARGILRRQGYRVIEARNGGEALLLCERHPGPIHLLLTDVVMPHMSGPELAARLRIVRPDMRLLCMSGYTDDSIVRHGVLSADIPYLQKPITPTALARRVREILA